VYYDGDTSKLPDYVLRWQEYYYSDEPRTPAYNDIV